MKIKFIILAFFFLFNHFSQELKASVTVDFSQATSANTQIFRTLEKQMNDFLNNTKFSDREYKNQEKISCSFFLNVSSFNNNDFECSLQIVANRPTFNSTYSSPLVNINDKEVSFKYIEFENFLYDPNGFSSNLIGVLSFYANIIIGLDLDSFSINSGDKYFAVAQNFAAIGQSSSYGGWQQASNKLNRNMLITELNTGSFSAFRETIYLYHSALDKMVDDQQAAKEKIVTSIDKLYELYKVKPSAYLVRFFFDTKVDEIVNLFSDGPKVNTKGMVNQLQSLSPLNSVNWNKIK